MTLHFTRSTALLYIGRALIGGVTRGQDESAQKTAEYEWLSFPDNAKFSVLGIHWFDENQPTLWPPGMAIGSSTTLTLTAQN